MRDSDQGLVITDPRGQVLLVNAPVVAALGDGAARLRYLDELPGLFGRAVQLPVLERRGFFSRLLDGVRRAVTPDGR